MFPGPTLLAAISAIIETALNRALELDPAGRRSLVGALTGPVQLDITAPVPLTYTLDQAGDRVRVSSQTPELPALRISGRPLAFAALAVGDDRVFTDGRLDVDGDTGLAHQLQRAINQLDPDWEAAIARHIGDVPAHFLGKRLRGAVTWSREAVRSMNANIEEYVHEESRTLPGRRELEATFGEIDALSLRAERLDARLRLLEESEITDEPENP